MANEQNLKPPWPPGTSGNPAGRKPGSFALATLVRNILEESLDWDLVPIKNTEELKQKYGKQGWKAIIYVATGQAIGGDAKAREWLRKAGYGDKLDITSGGSPIPILGGMSDNKDSGKQEMPNQSMPE